jgi:hypothetical protein
MVSPGVKALGGFEYISGAIFDTVPATFAPVFHDIYVPFGNHDFIGIQGNSPEFHFLISPRNN